MHIRPSAMDQCIACFGWNVAFAVVLSLARRVEESHVLCIYLIIIDWCTDSSAANTPDVPGDMEETRDLLASLLMLEHL